MCEKHPEAGGEVCGEFVCGMCQAEEPYVARKAMPPVDLTYGLFGHDPHFDMAKLVEAEARRQARR